jgi:ankyrin repeat protein
MGDFLPEGEEEEPLAVASEEEDSDDDETYNAPLPNAFRLANKPTRPKITGRTYGDTRKKLLAAVQSSTHIELKSDSESGLNAEEQKYINIILDDSGHTGLHFATALAKIQNARELIEFGADINRGNYSGETPLMRAVLVRNNATEGTFSTLLSLLAPSIQTLDHSHLVAGLPGRAAPARTYMATVLDWVAKEGAEAGLPLKTLVNVQDLHGDTALNIAARVGSKALIQLLLDAGADKARANKLGLKPVDYGIEVEVSSGSHCRRSLLC